MGHDYLLQFFEYKHLPPHLQIVSRPFCELANDLCGVMKVEKSAAGEATLLSVPANPERTTALRKLLEAKDCAVRAVLFK